MCKFVCDIKKSMTNCAIWNCWQYSYASECPENACTNAFEIRFTEMAIVWYGRRLYQANPVIRSIRSGFDENINNLWIVPITPVGGVSTPLEARMFICNPWLAPQCRNNCKFKYLSFSVKQRSDPGHACWPDRAAAISHSMYEKLARELWLNPGSMFWIKGLELALY